MLKRAGNPLHKVPGSHVGLTDEELAAYNAGFRAIQSDITYMEDVCEELDRLEKVIRWERPGSKAFATLVTPEFKNARAREDEEQFSSKPEISSSHPSRLARPA